MKETIRSVAAQLREEILNSTTKLPEDCTAQDSIKGECDCARTFNVLFGIICPGRCFPFIRKKKT